MYTVYEPNTAPENKEQNNQMRWEMPSNLVDYFYPVEFTEVKNQKGTFSLKELPHSAANNAIYLLVVMFWHLTSNGNTFQRTF